MVSKCQHGFFFFGASVSFPSRWTCIVPSAAIPLHTHCIADWSSSSLIAGRNNGPLTHQNKFLLIQNTKMSEVVNKKPKDLKSFTIDFMMVSFFGHDFFSLPLFPFPHQFSPLRWANKQFSSLRGVELFLERFPPPAPFPFLLLALSSPSSARVRLWNGFLN